MQKIISDEYLAFVRAKPCLVCGKRPVDADHIIARGSYDHKRIDYYALPFCRVHHAERHAVGNEKFESRYRIELWKEIAQLIVEHLIMVRSVK